MKKPERPPEFALHWAKELGAGKGWPERLSGGINNKVYRCESGDQKWVIKGYAPKKPAERDHMKAELQFLRYASIAAPDHTPKLLNIDSHRRCVILEYLEGTYFKEGVPPPPEAVDAAVSFIKLLNSDRRLAQDSIEVDAAEGFLSLTKHLENVRIRLEAMSTEHLDNSNKEEANDLLQIIASELKRVEDQTDRGIARGKVSDEISTSQRCVSPSDFGFHNAVATPTGIKFFDFEFAGWDDPAKTIIDFVLQPKIPVVGYPFPMYEAWEPREREGIRGRCIHLAPILRLKWLCIILSVLNPRRLKRIAEIIHADESTQLIHSRLEIAKNYMQISKSALEQSIS